VGFGDLKYLPSLPLTPDLEDAPVIHSLAPNPSPTVLPSSPKTMLVECPSRVSDVYIISFPRLPPPSQFSGGSFLWGSRQIPRCLHGVGGERTCCFLPFDSLFIFIYFFVPLAYLPSPPLKRTGEARSPPPTLSLDSWLACSPFSWSLST